MPSWVWVIILLIVITEVIICLMWYTGLLAAPDEFGQQRHPPEGQTGDAAPAPVRGPSPTPSRAAMPPPAMAGPQRRDPHAPAAPQGADDHASALGSNSLQGPRTASRLPAPASSPGTTAQSAAVPKRSSKAPPAQAAWSTPPEKTEGNR